MLQGHSTSSLSPTQRDYVAASQYGNEASFVANVIFTAHRHPGKKLRGLLALLKQGYDVRTAPFAIDILMVEGECKDWAYLETIR